LRDLIAAMRTELKPHPQSPPAAARQIAVDILRAPAAKMTIHFHLHGAIGEILLPPRSTSSRADGLWQHSCFEAFIRSAKAGGYHEFNFSPSTQWAAYQFDGYREGMRNAPGFETLPIEVRGNGHMLTLEAELDLAQSPLLGADEPWQLNVAAIVEEKDGTKSYWAVAHPAGAPDFHHPDCFVLQLPAASGT
jgi:hypothetical protein